MLRKMIILKMAKYSKYTKTYTYTRCIHRAYTHTHTHTHKHGIKPDVAVTNTHTHTHTHTHTNTHVYMCVYIYVCTYVYMHVCMYIHTNTHTKAVAREARTWSVHTQSHTHTQLQGRRGRGVCPPRTLRRPVVYVRTCKKGRHAQTRAPSVRPHVGGVEEEWCRMPLLGLYSSLATRGYLSCKIQSVVGLFCRAYSALCEFMK